MLPFWHPVWPSWMALGAIFGGSWRPMKPSWSHLGDSWSHLGTSWSLLVAILEPVFAIMRPLEPSGAHRTPIWGPFCLILVDFGTIFGTILRPFWGGRTTVPGPPYGNHFASFWDHFWDHFETVLGWENHSAVLNKIYNATVQMNVECQI